MTQPSNSLASDDFSLMRETDAARGVHLRDAFALLSPSDLACMIGVDERTVAVWRSQKRGPDFVRLGRAIHYRKADVDDWIEINVVPTDRAA